MEYNLVLYISIWIGYVAFCTCSAIRPHNTGVHYCTLQERKNDTTCTRLCHCSNGCEDNGNCGENCQRGWMGDHCQYRNIATAPMQTSSSSFKSYLTERYPVSAIRIKFNRGNSGNILIKELQISENDQAIGKSCLYNEVSINPIGLIDIPCDIVVSGREIMIHFNQSVYLGDIQVYGGRNVALWGDVSQSSTLGGGYHSSAVASWAVDGDDDNHAFANPPHSCSHTGSQEDPYWEINLMTKYTITRIEIENRNQNLGRRLNGFWIQGFCDSCGPQGFRIYNDITTSQKGPGDTIIIDISNSLLPRTLSKLRIQKSATGHFDDDVITLCEVRLFACRPEKQDHDDCLSLCPVNCMESETCLDLKCRNCKPGWTGLDCAKRGVCSLSISPPLRVNNPKSVYADRDTVTFTCDARYTLRGSSSSTCTSSGAWSVGIPTCKRVCSLSVSSPLRVINSKSMVADGDTVTFTCFAGYILTGSSSSTCTAGGTWSVRLPTCKRVCSLLVSTPLRVNDSKSVYADGDTVTFTCVERYILTGSSRSTCTSSGAWSVRLPTCKRVCSLSVSTPLRVNDSKSVYADGDTVKFTCVEGYILTGSSSSTCTSSGAWSVRLPTCKRVCSLSVSTPLRVNDSKSVYADGDTVTFTCVEGYILTGSSSSTCAGSGAWSVRLPTCKRTCSLSASVPVSVNNTLSVYTDGDTVTFMCEVGYTLTGSSSSTCTDSGNWSVGIPTCKKICLLSVLYPLQNLNNKSVYVDGDHVTFRCDAGYTLTGNDSTTCTGNGNWSGGVPTCKKLVSAEATFSVAGAAGGSAAGVVILLVAGIGIILFLKRRSGGKEHSRKKSESEMANMNYVHQGLNTYAKPVLDKRQKRMDKEESGYYNFDSADQENAKTARNEVYYDFSVPSKPSEHAIRVPDFIDYVDERKHNIDSLKAEFSKLKTGLQKSVESAKRPKNFPKNKYKIIYPYDETRVVLPTLDGKEDSDYINASYVHGYGDVRHYIAAQGPLQETLDDFWRMVWQEKVQTIVMLTNLVEERKMKCAQYWPDDGESFETNHLAVKLVDTEKFADFDIRVLSLIKKNKSRTVKQFHFTAWPDKDVPNYASSLVHFRTKVLSAEVSGSPPIIVHCSAGIGRTGTFIALDYLLQEAKETGFVDVFSCVETLRRQRVNMVQTLEQYMFVHLALLEALMSPTSATAAKDFPRHYQHLKDFDSVTKQQKLELEFARLNRTSPEIPDSEFIHAKESKRKKKNRYSNILPVNSERPLLESSEDDDQYINAVFLPAYREKESFIVTQMPLPNTVTDFWKLIHEQHVSTVVMLNTIHPADTSTGIYWPEDGGKSTFGKYTIEILNCTRDGNGDFEVVNLQYQCMEKKPETVRLFKAKFWPEDSKVPTTIRALLTLIETAELHHQRQKTGPMIVHCMNGCDKSGLYCVLQVVLERLKIEQDVGIQQIIKQMRSRRPQIIPNIEQYKFCHDAVIEFMQQYEAYSNFQ